MRGTGKSLRLGQSVARSALQQHSAPTLRDHEFSPREDKDGALGRRTRERAHLHAYRETPALGRGSNPLDTRSPSTTRWPPRPPRRRASTRTSRPSPARARGSVRGQVGAAREVGAVHRDPGGPVQAPLANPTRTTPCASSRFDRAGTTSAASCSSSRRTRTRSPPRTFSSSASTAATRARCSRCSRGTGSAAATSPSSTTSCTTPTTRTSSTSPPTPPRRRAGRAEHSRHRVRTVL